jgi:hypothetical protein
MARLRRVKTLKDPARSAEYQRFDERRFAIVA